MTWVTECNWRVSASRRKSTKEKAKLLCRLRERRVEGDKIWGRKDRLEGDGVIISRSGSNDF